MNLIQYNNLIKPEIQKKSKGLKSHFACYQMFTTLATEINMLHDSTQQAAMTAVQYAARCGEKLLQAKAACNHGEWLPWLEANCKVNHRQCDRYMRLARKMPELSNPNSSYKTNFDSVNSAIAYLSASDETKAEIDQSSEPVTEKQIKDLERKHKALEEEKRTLETRSEEWRQQYLAEREAKRKLEEWMPISDTQW